LKIIDGGLKSGVQGNKNPADSLISVGIVAFPVEFRLA
jgi:hypothetical protein